MKVRALEGTYSSFVWNRSGQPKPPTNGRDGPRGEARAKGAGGTGSLIAAEPSQRGGGRLPHLLESRRQRLVVEHVCVLRHVVPDVIEVEEGVGWGWGVDVATCSSSCSLLLARSPPGGALRSLRPRRGRQRLGGAGRGRSGRWRAGGDGGGGRKDPTGTLAPPRPPPGVGWPSRPRAGRHRKREPPTRPEARRTAVRRQATSATTTSRGAGRHCGPCSPPGLSPTPPTTYPVVVGLACQGGPAPPSLGRGRGAGRGAPPPPRGEAGRVRAEGWRRGGAGAATAGGGGVAHLNEPAWCGSGRGFSLSLSRGDAVGGGVLVGQSVKKKMSSSPRGNGQRGARR